MLNHHSKLSALSIPTVLAVGLLAVAPGMSRAGAAARKVIGVVVSSEGASVGNAPLIQGATLLSGDVVHTTSSGNVHVRIGVDAEISLGGGSVARFKSDSDRVTLEMSSGAAMARGAGGTPVTVQTPGYEVEPAERGRTLYIVAMLPAKTDVAARVGKLVITDVGSGRRTFVAAGEVAEIEGAASATGVPAGQDQESGKQAPGKAAGQKSGATKAAKKKNNNGIIILAGAAAAAAGIGLAVAAGGGGGGGAPPASPAGP